MRDKEDEVEKWKEAGEKETGRERKNKREKELKRRITERKD